MLATGQQQFQINNLGVNYAGAVLTDFPAGGLNEGDTVQISGQPDAGGTFIATRGSYLTKGLSGPPGTPAQVCGYITRFASVEDFDVNGQPVMTTTQTDITPSAADLTL